jgi:nitrogen fixation NifU-like protein
MSADFASREQPQRISIDELERVFSKKTIEHFTNPRNAGEFQAADGLGRASIPCGDTMQICLRVRNDRIIDAKYMTDGCGPVIACGSVLTEMVKGKTINEAMSFTEDDILVGLDGLPDSETHCATLAVSALKQALVDYLALRREPWKRTYRQTEPFTSSR